jgi:hypothetical protein
MRLSPEPITTGFCCGPRSRPQRAPNHVPGLWVPDPRNLTPGRQDHTTSPSVPASLVWRKPARPSQPALNVRDDASVRLLSRRGDSDGNIYSRKTEVKYFSPAIWTRRSNHIGCEMSRLHWIDVRTDRDHDAASAWRPPTNSAIGCWPSVECTAMRFCGRGRSRTMDEAFARR